MLSVSDFLEAQGLAQALVSREGVLMEVNAAMCALHKASAPELLEHSIDSLYTAAERPFASIYAELVEHPERSLSMRAYKGRSEQELHAVFTLNFSLFTLPDHHYILVRAEPKVTPSSTTKSAVLISHNTMELAAHVMIEGFAGIVSMSDEKGNLIFASRGIEEILGYEVKELQGTSNPQLIHPDDLDGVVAKWFESLATPEGVVECEYRAIHADGSYRILHSAMRNMLNVEGVGAILNVTRDVTQERERLMEARLQEEQFAIAQQMANVGSWELDVATGVVTPSDQLKRIFQLPINQPWSRKDARAQILQADLAKTDELVLRCMTHGESYEVEYELVRPDGERRTVVTIGKAARDATGKITRVHGSCQDITRTRRLEREREAYVGALERSNRELENFARVASHDLKEPLRKIQVFGSRLKSNAACQLDERGTKDLERMLSASARMLSLIEDLLTYARIDAAEAPMRPLMLSTVIDEVLDTLELTVHERRAEIVVGELPEVLGNDTLLHQLFQNLVANALKFCPPEHTPRIELEAKRVSRESGEAVVLSLTDNGIGFDPKHADTIFTPFRRLHGRSKYAGTGIGLAICRKIVEHHGGKISAISCPGEGSTFLITLPLLETLAAHSSSVDEAADTGVPG